MEIYNYYRRFAMTPLSLQLVEKAVHTEKQTKIVRVLNLASRYYSVKIQKYARIPQDQVIVLPPPDSEAPDDIFPERKIKKDSQSQRSREEEELIELWDRAKHKVWQLEMQDYQIARYFMKYFHLGAGLKDFGSVLPPTKFGIEHISGFLKDIESHTRFS